MKRLITILLVFAFIFLPHSEAARRRWIPKSSGGGGGGGPPAADLLNWPLNDTSGTTITATTGATGTTDGTWSTGLVLNGTSQEAFSSTSIAPGAQVLTVAAWINSTWNSGAATRMIWELGTDAGTGTAGTFNAYVDTPNSCVEIYMNDAAGNVVIKSIATPSSGNHHLAIVYDNSIGTMKAYVDGSSVSVTPVVNIWATAGNFATAVFNLGSRNSGASRWLNATIRNVRIWKSEVSAADIATIYGAGPT